MNNRIIWTHGYRPFVMGGPVNYIVGCDLPCDGPHDLGMGYQGYVAVAPNGKAFVSEATSGAIVGSADSLESALAVVKHDIETGDSAVMQEQVANGVEEAKRVEVVTVERFWHLLRCEKKSTVNE